MTDLIDLLYDHAEDHLLRGLLDQESEYASASCCAARQEKALRAQLDEKQSEHLDSLLEERHLMAFFEGQALFRAGFQMALELRR